MKVKRRRSSREFFTSISISIRNIYNNYKILGTSHDTILGVLYTHRREVPKIGGD